MSIVFRVDASISIGTGHAIRCLTLPDELRKLGAVCMFVCRELPGNLCELIETRGFAVLRLPGCATTVRTTDEDSLHAQWVGATWQEDASQTLTEISALGKKLDWLVVDHYGLDYRWESELRSSVDHIMVIDDLADRRHDCDLLLDQNLVANRETRYDGKTPSACSLLLGPEYALLQPCYADLHDRVPPREGPVRRMLVSFGGSDGVNLSGRTLSAFIGLHRSDVELDIVLGQNHAHAQAMSLQAAPHANIRLHSSLPTLAPLMARADLAIGAGGTTSWERLCLGLPSIIVTLADNQEAIAEELDARGLACLLGRGDEVGEPQLAQALRAALARGADASASERAMTIVDGRGVWRVSAVMTANAQTPLSVRHAGPADEALLLEWANDPVSRKHAFSTGNIAPDEHHAWFRDRLRDVENYRLFIVETATRVPVGQVRFERSGIEREISYALAPAFRGRGLGRALLDAGIARLRAEIPEARLLGRVKKGNTPSCRVFKALGFSKRVTPEGFEYRSTGGVSESVSAPHGARRSQTCPQSPALERRQKISRSFQINGREIACGRPCFVIAEMSANHNHGFDRAVRIVKAAKEAGADAVKLQTYTADTLTLDCDNEFFRIGKGSPWEGRTLYELYRQAHTPWDWHPKLMEVAEDLGIACFSTPFSLDAVDFLEKLDVPAYKIASFELVDIPLIRRVARTMKPIILSTGMATLEEIEDAVGAIRAQGNERIALLKCTSASPARPEDMDLLTIPDLAARFGLSAGLSDHTLGIAVPVCAVALGACIVEKHLTLDRAAGGPDAAFSLEPVEFKAMVAAVRETESALGRVRYGATAHEIAGMAFRRSLFAVEAIKAGEEFTERNVRSIRPAAGLSPKLLPQILGKRAARDIRRGTPMCLEFVDRRP